MTSLVANMAMKRALVKDMNDVKMCCLQDSPYSHHSDTKNEAE
jgi:hypothetical protein